MLVRNWQEFTDRAIDLLIENPTQSKFVLKYMPKLHKFVLKVTDGTRLVMRKCDGNVLNSLFRNFSKFRNLSPLLDVPSPMKVIKRQRKKM